MSVAEELEDEDESCDDHATSSAHSVSEVEALLETIRNNWTLIVREACGDESFVWIAWRRIYYSARYSRRSRSDVLYVPERFWGDYKPLATAFEEALPDHEHAVVLWDVIDAMAEGYYNGASRCSFCGEG